MDTNILKNVLRIGKVSAVDGQSCRARVTFGEQENLVSQWLPVLVMGSKETKGYWEPEVDTQVLCVFLPNTSGQGLKEGFIMGAFYSDVDTPVECDPDVRSVTFVDGSRVRYDHGNIKIVAKGDVIIEGRNIFLNSDKAKGAKNGGSN